MERSRWEVRAAAQPGEEKKEKEPPVECTCLHPRPRQLHPLGEPSAKEEGKEKSLKATLWAVGGGQVSYIVGIVQLRGWNHAAETGQEL